MNKIVFSVYLLAVAFTLLACCDEVKTHQEYNTEAVQIRYIKDHRTQLCFALLPSIGAYATQAVSMATVPCSQVDSLLEEMPKINDTYWK